MQFTFNKCLFQIIILIINQYYYLKLTFVKSKEFIFKNLTYHNQVSRVDSSSRGIPCTGFFCGCARRCSTRRISCICFLDSCARTCPLHRNPCTRFIRFFCGCARRCHTTVNLKTCVLKWLFVLGEGGGHLSLKFRKILVVSPLHFWNMGVDGMRD